MHVDHDIVEYVAAEEPDYEEVIEEYEEEIFVSEEFQEPSVTDTADLASAQGKPRCITSILIIFICICVVHLRCRSFMISTCIYIIYP
jgi:hypothetical protein